MQCQCFNTHSNDFSDASLTHLEGSEMSQLYANPVHFQTRFAGHMEMYSDAATVIKYLNAHQGWFRRCAAPMKTQTMGHNGYILTVGRFGAFGYDVEPSLAVVLELPEDGIYSMYSTAIPDEPNLGYEVDYQASMAVREIPVDLAGMGVEKAFKKEKITQVPDKITKVDWQLRMNVAVQFPKFIQKLPLPMIQKTGDRLLTQIVRQISPRLTHKVQQDFHSSHNLPIPPKTSRHLEKIEEGEEQAA
ncbi:MAG: DUF1997 domain-containing protein [Cyanobacteria bacterium P01_G01_bin.49]